MRVLFPILLIFCGLLLVGMFGRGEGWGCLMWGYLMVATATVGLGVGLLIVDAEQTAHHRKDLRR